MAASQEEPLIAVPMTGKRSAAIAAAAVKGTDSHAPQLVRANRYAGVELICGDQTLNLPTGQLTAEFKAALLVPMRSNYSLQTEF